MPSQYTGTPTRHTQLTLPSGGDPRTAASVGLPFSQLWDTLLYAISEDVVAPLQVTSNADNFNPTGWSSATVVRLTSDTTRTINGASGAATQKVKLLINVGSFAMFLGHMEAGQAAGNQFSVAMGADFRLGPGDSCWIFHDDATNVWRVVGVAFGGNYLWSGLHVWSAAAQFLQTLVVEGILTLKNSLVFDHAAADIFYSPARARERLIPLMPFTENGEQTWSHSRILGATTGVCYSLTSASARRFMVPIQLDSGSVLTGVHAVVQDSGSSVLSVRCWRQNEDFGGLGFPTITQIGSTYSTGGSASPTLAIITGITPETIDNEHHTYWVEFSVPAGSDVNYVRGLRVHYNDFGPRNR